MEKLKDTYSITDAAKQSGLSPRKIRYLEELGHIVPEYIEMGSTCQRRYSPALIDQLAKIAELRRQGFEVGAAVSKVKEGNEANEDRGI